MSKSIEVYGYRFILIDEIATFQLFESEVNNLFKNLSRQDLDCSIFLHFSESTHGRKILFYILVKLTKFGLEGFSPTKKKVGKCKREVQTLTLAGAKEGAEGGNISNICNFSPS